MVNVEHPLYQANWSPMIYARAKLFLSKITLNLILTITEIGCESSIFELESIKFPLCCVNSSIIAIIYLHTIKQPRRRENKVFLVPLKIEFSALSLSPRCWTLDAVFFFSFTFLSSLWDEKTLNPQCWCWPCMLLTIETIQRRYWMIYFRVYIVWPIWSPAAALTE